MRLIIRTIVVLAILWIGVLLSGYGVLMGSSENAGGWDCSVNISRLAASVPHNMFIPAAVLSALPIALSCEKRHDSR